MHHRSASGVTALAAALLCSFAAAPAAATAAAPYKPAAHPAGSHAARSVGGSYNINGYNWGGYVASGATFTSIAATWTEPTVRCNSRNDLMAPWVGIDGYSSSTVEQTGVATDCSSGSAVYQAWYEMYPANPVYLSASTYPVRAGDSIHASVTYAGSHKYTLAISDTTRGWNYSTSKTLTASNANAEAIIESPTGAYPNFGSLTFSSVTANGKTIGSYGTTALDPSANGVYEAHASALTGGNKFTMTYSHE